MSSLIPPFPPAALAAARLKRVLVVVSAVCVGGLAAGVGPAHATFPGQNGKIVFTHLDDPEDETTADIYTVSPNGRHLRNLTPGSRAADDSPRLERGRAHDRLLEHPEGSRQPHGRPRDLRDERRRIRAAAGHEKKVNNGGTQPGRQTVTGSCSTASSRRRLRGRPVDRAGQRNGRAQPDTQPGHRGRVSRSGRRTGARSCSCATTAGASPTSPRSARTAPTPGTDRHAHRRGGSGLVP